MDEESEPEAEPRRSALDRWHLRDMSPSRRLLVVRGALAVAFGLLALPWPGVTLWFLAALFIGWALLAGLACLGSAWRNRATLPGWRVILVSGTVGVLAAAATPYAGAALPALALVVGLHALLTGVLDVVLAARGAAGQRGLHAAAGFAAIAFGALVLLLRAPGGPTLAWLVALYAAGHGGLLLAQAFRTSRLAGWQGARPSHRPSG